MHLVLWCIEHLRHQTIRDPCILFRIRFEPILSVCSYKPKRNCIVLLSTLQMSEAAVIWIQRQWRRWSSGGTLSVVIVLCVGFDAFCDVCDQAITGVRYKCGQVKVPRFSHHVSNIFVVYSSLDSKYCLSPSVRNIYLFLIAFIVLLQLLSGLRFMCIM